MTLDLPAAGPDVIRWAQALVPARQLAEVLADTEFVPRPMRGKPDMVTAAIMYGDEIGVGPMQALAGIDVIEGTPRPNAQLLRALIYRAGHSLVFHEMTGLKCRASGLRTGEPESARVYVEWTIDMARSAGLLGKKNWREYPRSMLANRVSAELARIKFPDVIKGLGYVAEAGPDDLGNVDVPGGPEPENPTPARAPVARKRRPRLPSPGHHPVATEDRPAPDGSVDVPLPETDEEVAARVAAMEAHAVPVAPADDGLAPWDQPARWPRPGASQDAEPEPDETAPDPEAEAEPQPADTPPVLIADAPRRAIFAALGKMTNNALTREERLAICSAIVGREVTSSTALTKPEGYQVLAWLDRANAGAVGWSVDPNTGRVTLETYRTGP